MKAIVRASAASSSLPRPLYPSIEGRAMLPNMTSPSGRLWRSAAGKAGPQSAHLGFEKRQVVFDHIPHKRQIDAPVSVDQAIAERDDLSPGCARPIAYCGGQA